MKLVLNLYNNISSLSLMDILFIVMFVILLILVISLISIFRHNDENINQEEIEKKEIPLATLEEKGENEIVNMEAKKPLSDELDLPSITKELENMSKSTVNLTPYEEEQEEKAIISYDELIKTRSDLKINYQEEEHLDDVLVKKVDMENMTSEIDISEIKEKIEETNKAPVVISYEKEEAFLESLKKLQQMLNS